MIGPIHVKSIFKQRVFRFKHKRPIRLRTGRFGIADDFGNKSLEFFR